MGLATIDPHSQKEHTEIPQIPKFGVLTEIQVFKNGKNLPGNVWKCGQIQTFVCNFFFNLAEHFISILIFLTETPQNFGLHA